MDHRNLNIKLLSAVGLGALITVFIAAAPPASLLRNESTTNAPAKFPDLLPTSFNFMSPVGHLGGLNGTIVQAGGGIGMNANITIFTNNWYGSTNPITANTPDVSKPGSITNCSANPTFSGLAGVTNGLQFGTVVGILANGADRTVSITAANVHVYPSGTLVVTNGSFGVLSIGGVGGSYTGAVFLPFP